jgi:hypothetical protein
MVKVFELQLPINGVHTYPVNKAIQATLSSLLSRLKKEPPQEDLSSTSELTGKHSPVDNEPLIDVCRIALRLYRERVLDPQAPGADAVQALSLASWGCSCHDCSEVKSYLEGFSALEPKELSYYKDGERGKHLDEQLSTHAGAFAQSSTRDYGKMVVGGLLYDT